MDQLVMVYIVLITMSGALHVILAIIAYMNKHAFEGMRTFCGFLVLSLSMHLDMH